MSTHWELECMDCGASTEWGQSSSTNRIDYLLGPLCESGGIQALVAASLAFEQLVRRLGDGAGGGGPLEWSVSLHRSWYPGDLNIDLAGTFRGCAGHKIWPRNEYGDWHRDAPVVVTSEPMANARSPADPNKTKPYWHTDRLPRKSKPANRKAPLTDGELAGSGFPDGHSEPDAA